MNFDFTVVKTPFALLQIQLKMLFRNAVELTQMPFCLTPKVLNSIDVVLLFSKMRTVVDAEMVKFAHVQYVKALIAIGINDAVRRNLLAGNR